MSNLHEAFDLMSKLCNVSVSDAEIEELIKNVEEKKKFIRQYDIARCASQLQRIKEIIQKVEDR